MPLTPDELAEYREQGLLVQRGLFEPDEVALLLEAATSDAALDEHAFGRDDGEGGNVRLSLWNHPGDDVYGAVARCRRVVDRAEALVGGEVYHYHSKMVLKDPEVGGAWAWHQDYGYWYENGLLYPDLVSMFLALDPATRENGCLQVVPRSHHLGRLQHLPLRSLCYPLGGGLSLLMLLHGVSFWHSPPNSTRWACSRWARPPSAPARSGIPCASTTAGALSP